MFVPVFRRALGGAVQMWGPVDCLESLEYARPAVPSTALFHSPVTWPASVLGLNRRPYGLCARELGSSMGDSLIARRLATLPHPVLDTQGVEEVAVNPSEVSGRV